MDLSDPGVKQQKEGSNIYSQLLKKVFQSPRGETDGQSKSSTDKLNDLSVDDFHDEGNCMVVLTE